MCCRNLTTVKYKWDEIIDLYILCSGHDLKRLRLSNIYLTYYKLVRIRMLFDLVDLSDHDLIKICI